MILAGKSLHLRMVCMLMTMGVSLSKSSVTGFQVKPHSCFSKLGILQSRRSFLLLSSTRLASTLSSPHETKRIAIVGGGLAGLSTVFHLLEQAINNSNSQEYTVQPPLNITVFDKSTAGSGGASSVAGGYVCPRKECQDVTSRLITETHSLLVATIFQNWSRKINHICYS